MRKPKHAGTKAAELPENKIKAGYDSVSKLYIFELPRIYNAKDMKVDGVAVTSPIGGFCSRNLVTTTERPKRLTYSIERRVLTGYNLKGVIIATDDYDSRVAKLQNGRVYDEDINEYTYPSVEMEVAYRHFVRDAIAQYENVVEIRPMSFEIIDYPVSAYACIVPMYTLTGTTIDDTRCTLTPNPIKILRKLCVDEFDIDDLQIDTSYSHGFEYAKIGKHYINTTALKHYERNEGRSCTGSYSECVQRMHHITNVLRTILKEFIAKHSTKPLNAVEIGYTTGKLVSIQTLVNKLDPKVKDRNEYYRLRKQVKELHEALTRIAHNEGIPTE